MKHENLKVSKIPLKIESIIKQHFIPIMRGKKIPKPILNDGETVISMIDEMTDLQVEKVFEKVIEMIMSHKKAKIGRDENFVTVRDLYEFL